MTNNEVIKCFLYGKYAKTTHLESVGNKLINYKTVIVWWGDSYINQNPDIVYINYKWYSHTTRVIQNKLISMCKEYGITIEQ